MELLSMKKRAKVTLDNFFDAFRAMTREDITMIWINQHVFSLVNPIENVWFVYAFDAEGNQIASAKFDQFDL